MLQHIHRKAVKKPFDVVVYFFVFTTPMFELPQAWHIYTQRSAANVSLVTWGYFLLTNFAWLAYGLHHKIRPIIISYILYMLVEGSIVAGILLYS